MPVLAAEYSLHSGFECTDCDPAKITARTMQRDATRAAMTRSGLDFDHCRR